MADPKALTESRYNQVEDCDPLPEQEKAAVRRLIAVQVDGSNEEKVELMKMLGIHPSQDNDRTPTTGTPVFNMS